MVIEVPVLFLKINYTGIIVVMLNIRITAGKEGKRNLKRLTVYVILPATKTQGNC